MRAPLSLFLLSIVAGPHRAALAKPSDAINYTITVDPAQPNEYRVTMDAVLGSRTLTLVMARHPEYDERFWRFITDLSATANGKKVDVIRDDSARWHLGGAGAGRIHVQYRIVMPDPPAVRPSWRPYVGSNMALVGGPDSFLYPLERNALPFRVHIEAPRSWKIATGMPAAPGDRNYAARTVFELTDSPLLLGTLHTWSFEVNGVPHHIAYAPLPDAAPFDTIAFARLIERMTRATVAMFRTMPYKAFTFLYQDGAYGGLEHATSVSSGVPSSTLARDLHEDAGDLAHEFIHTWNLVAFHPVGRGGAREGPWPLSTGLWLSEGVTMFYTDVMLRRAGVLTASRTATLADDISSYFTNPGNTHVAPERSSMYSDEPPGGTGDYNPSVHTQGQMIGTVLDLMIRDSTKWQRSLDDVMRTLYNTRTAKGFSAGDVIAAVEHTCSCNAKPFFDRYVSHGAPVDFNAALRTAGLRMTVTVDTTRASDGSTQPDMTLWAYAPRGGSATRLIVNDPEGVWGRAGLHTNDEIVAWDNKPIGSMNDFRTSLRAIKTGSTVMLRVRHNGVLRDATVVVPPATRTTARVEDLPGASALQRSHRAIWMAAKR